MEKKKEFTIVVEKDEDNYYVGEVIELPGCHSQAKSMDELMKRMQEAISLYLEVKADVEMPSFVGLQKLKVPLPSPA